MPWWACPYCPPPASFVNVDAFCKHNPVSHKMIIIFILIFINRISGKEHFVQSCRFTNSHWEESHRSCFCIWEVGRERLQWVKVVPLKHHLKLVVCGLLIVVLPGESCCHWRLFFLAGIDKGTYYMFCLKQKSWRLDVSCICCQQNLCQDDMESW